MAEGLPHTISITADTTKRSTEVNGDDLQFFD